jgi:secondary thiamine-phosphate synthase enzyme
VPSLVAARSLALRVPKPGRFAFRSRWRGGLAVAGQIRRIPSAEDRDNQEATRMKSFRKELWFEIPSRRAFVNITPQVEQGVRESGVREGLALVNAMHITASVFINDDESGLHQDYEAWLEQLAPHEPTSQYHHNRTGEDNADAHLKRQVMGREVVVAITGGKLDFGPWEQIFYGEFDGRRRKRVLLKIIGE